MPAYDLSNISSNTDRSTNPHHTKLAAFDHVYLPCVENILDPILANPAPSRVLEHPRREFKIDRHGYRL